MLKRTCAATIVGTPIASFGAASPRRPASAGLSRSKTVTKAMSVAMPITTPGTMMRDIDQTVEDLSQRAVHALEAERGERADDGRKHGRP